MEFILASASPRRKEILTKAGFKFKIVSSRYDENISNLKYSDELLENCAYQKGLEVKNRLKTDKIIVSADTVVVLDNIILGKPKNFDDAFNMLKNLSGKTHFVATAISIISSNNKFLNYLKTYVTFRELSNSDIENYILNYKPFDKAGSYGIQDEGFDFVQDIKGDFDNVVGFPLVLFKEMYFNCINDKPHY